MSETSSGRTTTCSPSLRSSHNTRMCGSENAPSYGSSKCCRKRSQWTVHGSRAMNPWRSSSGSIVPRLGVLLHILNMRGTTFLRRAGALSAFFFLLLCVHFAIFNGPKSECPVEQRRSPTLQLRVVSPCACQCARQSHVRPCFILISQVLLCSKLLAHSQGHMVALFL